MDITSLSGLLIAIVAILGGQILEGGHLGSLLQIAAFLIVIGGTLGATMLQTSPPVFVAGVRLLPWVFVPPVVDYRDVIRRVVTWSQAARPGFRVCWTLSPDFRVLT